MNELAPNPLEFSIVVTGEHCNPSILNPDFLRIEDIVPKAWDWELQGPPLTTLPLSNVTYSSGISIVVEAGRVLVIDKKYKGDLDESKVPLIAQKYVETLSKVRYTGVGINYKMLVEMKDPASVLRNRFLRYQCCGKQTDKLEKVSLKLGFPRASGVLNFSLENVQLPENQDGKISLKTGILVSGNFHRVCSGYPTAGKIIDYISNWKTDFDDFSSTLAEIFGVDDTDSKENNKE